MVIAPDEKVDLIDAAIARAVITTMMSVFDGERLVLSSILSPSMSTVRIRKSAAACVKPVG